MVFMENAGPRNACLFWAILSLLAPVHCDGILPPDPNNAGLLYYQAFLLCPPPDPGTRAAINRVSNGGEPDLQIRRYLGQCGSAIRYAQMATHLSHCDWGLPYSLGLGYPMPHLEASRSFARVLHANVRVLTADGEYRAAFEQCLAIRRLAKHVGNETVMSYATAMHVEKEAQSCICQVLESASPDVGMIIWAQNRLADTPPVSRSVAKALRIDLEFALQIIREGSRIELIRDNVAEVLQGRGAKNVSDEDIIAHLRSEYTDFLESALRVIDSNLPYEKKHRTLEIMVNDLQGEGVNPVMKSMGVVLGNTVLGSYEVQVMSNARLNAFRAAVSLYLEKAKTRQLPERLPAGVPRDPYSGQNFIYATTDRGFVLRSSVQPIGGREVFELRCGSE